MPKDYFSSMPKIEYDINNDGEVKIAIDVLTRIRKRANFVASGAVFYNYAMRDGDTLEIVADKYYGNPKYHWVVAIINDIYHHTYDLPIESRNFDRFIADKYGSYERSVGVTKQISDADIYSTSNVYSESYSVPQTSDNNPLIVTGNIPSGNTTTIKLSASSDPFSTIGVGDFVDLFVPQTWYNLSSTNSAKLGYTEAAEIVAKSTRSDGTYAISTNMNSGTYPEFEWQADGWLRVTSNTTSSVSAGTANQTHIWLATNTLNDSYATNGFITFTATPGATDSAELVGNTFAIESYDNGYKVVILPETYKLAENFQSGWDYTITHGGYNLTSGDILIQGETVTMQTGIHHMEMDVYDDEGTLLLGDHRITKNEYIDSSVGTVDAKRIVNNYDFEDKDNNDKRNIILLKAEFLQEFLTQFYSLVNRRG